MADLFYLSLWVRDFSPDTMLATWAKVVAEFPASSLKPGVRQLTAYPFHWSDPPVLEESLEEGAAMEQVVPLVAEFLHEDYAYEVELHWDVWMPRSSESLDQWERVPERISIACLGPAFEEEEEDEGRPHLLLNLGLDSILLPEPEDRASVDEALEGVAGNCYRENIAQLVG